MQAKGRQRRRACDLDTTCEGRPRIQVGATSRELKPLLDNGGTPPVTPPVLVLASDAHAQAHGIVTEFRVYIFLQQVCC